jgi:hypothetical protein
MSVKSLVTAAVQDAMQVDRDSGMTVRAIAKKYGTSAATVSNNTEGFRAPSERDKKNWPEWKQWDELHRKYGNNGNK